MTKAAKPHQLNQSPFFGLRSPHKLAELLRVRLTDLQRLTAESNRLYREFDDKKPGGGTRHIENPRKDLKAVQKRAAELLGRIQPADYLYCPVKRRCYVTNAARHRGNRVVRCLDVRKYFPSTPAWRVFWFFREVMKCEPDIAGMLVRLATFNGHLPTGSPLSPIMAYFAFYDVWENVALIASRNDCTLTVYVDDVTVSGTHVRAGVLWEIKRTIHGSGLRYHKEKSYIDCPAEITGVIVDGERLRSPSRQHKKLHELKRALTVEGHTKQLRGRLDGVAGCMSQIDRVDRTRRASRATS